MGFRHNPEKAFGRVLNNEENSRSNSADETPIAYHGKVVTIEDQKNSKRIRVRILGIDDLTLTEELPWAISAMPNFFFCLPQLGEHVLVFLMNPWNKQFTRVYMGPLQTENNGEESFDDTMVGFGFQVPRKDK